jgi:hypothetical protein
MNNDVQREAAPSSAEPCSAATPPQPSHAVENLSPVVARRRPADPLATGAAFPAPKAPGCRHRSTACRHAADALSTPNCCPVTAATRCVRTTYAPPAPAVDNSRADIITTTEINTFREAESPKTQTLTVQSTEGPTP